MINLTEASELYNKLHNPVTDRVKCHLVSIHNGINDAVHHGKDHVYYLFQHDDKEQTIDAVCTRLENKGFKVERLEHATNGWGIPTLKRDYPARITIYGWA